METERSRNLFRTIPAILIICVFCSVLGVIVDSILFEEFHSGWGQKLVGIEAIRMFIWDGGILNYITAKAPCFIRSFAVSFVACILVVTYLGGLRAKIT
jgi:hypothetical protein